MALKTKRFWLRFLALALAVVLIVVGFHMALTHVRVSERGYSGPIGISATARPDGGFTITAVSHKETPGNGRLAVEIMVERINENQSLGVDTVSGATVTSAAVLRASARSLGRLGYDVKALSQPVSSGGDVEIINIRCDVVVVGAGGAGLSAAIEAAKGGARVVIIEKQGLPGGSTALSDGRILASNTDIQKDNYITSDTSISFASYYMDYSLGKADSTSVMNLAEHSAANIEFLQENGVSFSRGVELPVDGTQPARNHVVKDGSYEGGGLIVEALHNAALENNIDILFNTEAFELMTDSIGVVRGVSARRPNGSVLNISAKATVLCTGGYSESATLVTELAGPAAGESLASEGNTGDGVEMARAIGASTREGGLMAELRDLSAGTDGDTGLLVTPSGARFTDESQNAFAQWNDLVAAGYSKCWRIVDQSGTTRDFSAAVERGDVVAADSIEQLAELIGAPDLAETFERYNRFCAQQSDWQFNKDAQYLNAISEKRMVFAVRCEGVSYGSLGGLVTDSGGAVLSQYGAIPGLFAAGEVANSGFFNTEFPGFGSSLAQVVETGRVAGAEAAAFALERAPDPVPQHDEFGEDEQDWPNVEPSWRNR